MRERWIRGRRIVLPEGVRDAAVRIEDGRIASVEAYAAAEGRHVVDAGDLVVMPGLVDTHVHINEPGRTAWEGFATATRAAAAGGITTLIDMPLNSIPATTDVDALAEKVRSAEGQCRVDVGFWGGVVPGNADQIEPLVRAGVLGFKCFLVPSGVPEFEAADERTLREALPIISRLGVPLLVHAERPERLRAPEPSADPRHYDTWLATRPPEAETAAVRMMIELAREFDVHIHIVHVTAAESAALIAAARQEGVRASGETCPHYLSFTSADVPDGAVAFKCAPPIRNSSHRQALWDALRSGALACVVTDHSPAPPSVKRLDSGNFVDAWGGIASLQISLPAVWTEASARGFGIDAVAGWMAEAPARLAGLAAKGRIGPGRDADFVIWDPEATFVVDAATLEHRHKITPYDGRELMGQVRQTIVRGTTVYENGSFPGASAGRVIRRSC